MGHFFLVVMQDKSITVFLNYSLSVNTLTVDVFPSFSVFDPLITPSFHHFSHHVIGWIMTNTKPSGCLWAVKQLLHRLYIS